MKFFIQGIVLCCAGLSMQSFALGYSKDFEVCMRSVSNQTAGIKKCQIKELKIQNKRVKKLYKYTLKNANPIEKPLVEQMQSKWYQQRERACNLTDKKPRSYTVNHSSCALQMTLPHADMLEVRSGNKVLK